MHRMHINSNNKTNNKQMKGTENKENKLYTISPEAKAEELITMLLPLSYGHDNHNNYQHEIALKNAKEQCYIIINEIKYNLNEEDKAYWNIVEDSVRRY